MKEFTKNLGLLILLVFVTVALNCARFIFDHWVLTYIVVIHDTVLIVCFLLWTGHHAMMFVMTLARDYKKVRDHLRGKP